MDTFRFAEKQAAAGSEVLVGDGMVTVRHRFLMTDLRVPLDSVVSVAPHRSVDEVQAVDAVQWLFLSGADPANVSLVVDPPLRLRGFRARGRRFFLVTGWRTNAEVEGAVATMAIEDPRGFIKALSEQGVPVHPTTTDALHHTFGPPEEGQLEREDAQRRRRADRVLRQLGAAAIVLGATVAGLLTARSGPGASAIAALLAGVATPGVSWLVARHPEPRPIKPPSRQDPSTAIVVVTVLVGGGALLALRPGRDASPALHAVVTGIGAAMFGGTTVGFFHRPRHQVDLAERAELNT